MLAGIETDKLISPKLQVNPDGEIHGYPSLCIRLNGRRRYRMVVRLLVREVLRTTMKAPSHRRSVQSSRALKSVNFTPNPQLFNFLSSYNSQRQL